MPASQPLALAASKASWATGIMALLSSCFTSSEHPSHRTTQVTVSFISPRISGSKVERSYNGLGVQGKQSPSVSLLTISTPSVVTTLPSGSMITSIGHCSTRNASPSFCLTSYAFWGKASQGMSAEKSMSTISNGLPSFLSLSYIYSSICWKRLQFQCQVAENSTPMYFPSNSAIETELPSPFKKASPSMLLMFVCRFSSQGNCSAKESPSSPSIM
mmetsp:Transcript_62002/g.166390  ORF Transcript_62002/g.166390 Transcript_62002/m.166390 type:complete len:216 (+) Transcript_62002:530-1177(+)